MKEFTEAVAIDPAELSDELFVKDDSAYVDADRMTRPSLSYWSDAWRRFRSNKVAMVSAVILTIIILMAILQPMFSPYDYDTQDLFSINQGPSAEHIFGTDNLGRDIFTRCWEGARVSLAIAFVVASGVILTAQISTRLLAAPDYYEAWHYVPVLTLATTFGCLGSFLSSIYMVEQRSGAILATTLLGAAVNVGGNLFFIPIWGSMGAAISTLVSYILIFGVRALHTRTMLRIRWDLARFLPCCLLLGVQCAIVEYRPPIWPLWSGACFLTVAALHFRPLLRAARRAI